MTFLFLGLSEHEALAARRALGTEGSRVLRAGSAQEALGWAGAEPPSVVLISGIDIEELTASCSQLRSSPLWRDTVIVASVLDGDKGGQAALNAGADDFFVATLGEGVLRSRLLVAKRTAEGVAARRAAELDRDLFFDLSLDLFCVASFDGRFKMVNAAWTSALGWSADELTTTQWLDFVHPEDHALTLAAGAALMSGEPLTRFTNRYRTKAGSYRWLDWQAAPALDRATIYAVVRDVTDARAAKEELRELAESLSTTLQSIADGVIATDAAGAIVRMNPVAERLTGWSETEARGHQLQEIFRLVNEDTRAEVPNPVDRSLRENAVVGLDGRTLLIRRDGSEIPIGDSCAPIRTGEGVVNGAVLVFRDQTLERETATVQAKYEQRLIFADRMASVGTLAAGVAHEINNPLTYVAANVETAIEEVQALSGGSASSRMKDLEELLAEARAGTTRITKIVRGLKTFSRLDDERRDVVDLIPVLELAINMAFNEIRHRARLVKDYGKLPPVDADDARLGQVFINLLVNAAQAFSAGGTEQNEIRVVSWTDVAGRAVVEIRDNGPGIAPAHLSRIFDPFFTTKPVGVGTGLGLAICHNIIAGMGGEVSVASDLGKGTTFRVTLPPSNAVAATAPLSTRSPEPAPRRLANVLLVDDDPSVGLAVRRVLRQHDVTVLASAKEALDLIVSEGRVFDVILSDLMMPQMSGIEFYTQLARRVPKMATRVVFVSGGAFTPEAHEFLERVPNERIDKPFSVSQLRDVVQKFVKSGPQESGIVR